MQTEFWLEWIDRDKMEANFRAAIRSANRKRMEGSPELDLEEEREDGFLDWSPPEYAVLSRRFPSLAMAKGWGKRNRERDLWEMPRISVHSVHPKRPWDWEQIEAWSLEGEEWERME